MFLHSLIVILSIHICPSPTVDDDVVIIQHAFLELQFLRKRVRGAESMRREGFWRKNGPFKCL